MWRRPVNNRGQYCQRGEMGGTYMGVVETLAPVRALLRFGLGGKGREPHPLSSYDASAEDFDASRDWSLYTVVFFNKTLDIETQDGLA